jgi:hypothetical protein
MSAYSDTVKNIFHEYHEALKSISAEVQAFGGSGNIHGCIIDIDFFNHVYLNPNDGEISQYFATSIVDKYFYPDIKSLLSAHMPELCDRFNKLIKSKDPRIDILKVKQLPTIQKAVRFISETYMYHPSRVMRSIQYLLDSNVIRIWNPIITYDQLKLLE